MSERPVDREAETIRSALDDIGLFVGLWYPHGLDTARIQDAQTADAIRQALDRAKPALGELEARVVLLEAQLAEARKIVHAAKIVNDLDTREGAGEDIDGYDWRRAFNDLDHALAAVSVADSGPEKRTAQATWEVTDGLALLYVYRPGVVPRSGMSARQRPSTAQAVFDYDEAGELIGVEVIASVADSGPDAGAAVLREGTPPA